MTDRKQHWEQIYTTKSTSAVSWYQEEPRLSVELIENTKAGFDAPIVDIGAGASFLVDRLYALGYRRLAVLDISGAALAVAQERLANTAANIEWFDADVTQFVAPRPFSVWHDRAVFHFLTDPEDRRRYIETLTRTLMPLGHVIIGTFAIGGPTRCSGLEIVQYDATKLISEFGKEFSLLEERTENHSTPTHHKQPFAFFRLRYTP